MASWLSVLRSRHRNLVLSTQWRSSLLAGRTTSRYPRLFSNTTIPPVTDVEKIVIDSIKATGPLPFATYVQLCLSHPTHGYYMNPSNPVFGTRGDFITSPEISQIFGELVGIWLVSQWQNAKSSSSLRLVELGPGRGTLMADVLRVIAKFVPESKLKDVHLVETSPAMRRHQESKLQEQAEQMRFKLHWHDSVNDVPLSRSYSMILAHEFFDALPFHVLQKINNSWHEVMVASSLDPIRDPRSNRETDAASLTKDFSAPYPRLRRVVSPVPTAASAVLGLSSPRFQNLPPGSTIEVSPASFKIARKIAELLGVPSNVQTPDQLDTSGGCGLIVDYGGAKVFGNSFRAFKDHKIVDVFHRPGECDLTVNVDFAFLKESMGNLVDTHGPISQWAFLEGMGMRLRLLRLLENAKTEERRSIIQEAANRLVDRTGMGAQYQVMGITSVRGKTAMREVWPFVEETVSKIQHEV